jgi:hypothetical protein
VAGKATTQTLVCALILLSPTPQITACSNVIIFKRHLLLRHRSSNDILRFESKAAIYKWVGSVVADISWPLTLGLFSC